MKRWVRTRRLKHTIKLKTMTLSCAVIIPWSYFMIRFYDAISNYYQWANFKINLITSNVFLMQYQENKQKPNLSSHFAHEVQPSGVRNSQVVCLAIITDIKARLKRDSVAFFYAVDSKVKGGCGGLTGELWILMPPLHWSLPSTLHGFTWIMNKYGDVRLPIKIKHV